MKSTTEAKFNKLKEDLSSGKSLAIAYSGGVDSSLLSAVAVEILGENVLGIFLNSPLIPNREYNNAVETAAEIGLRLKVIDFDPFLVEGLSSNPKNRCYICKSHIAGKIKEFLKNYDITEIADGQNVSDLGEYRPGIKASDEAGILHPFIKAGINKDEIREIARELGLSSADKPSSACLASRIPYGDEINPKKLGMVERAEDILFSLGFNNFRVRLHGDIARIEVLPSDFLALLQNKDLIMKELKNTGFKYICLDMGGYRSGSMDEI